MRKDSQQPTPTADNNVTSTTSSTSSTSSAVFKERKRPPMLMVHDHDGITRPLSDYTTENAQLVLKSR